MRRLCPRGLPYVALGCAILATQTLKADTILINDLPGLFTFSVTDPVREQASIEAPGFANVAIFNPPGATLIDSPGLFEILVMEPVGTGCSPFSCASDFIIGDESDLPSGDTIVDVTFTVEDESFFADCSSEPCIQENGDVQNFAALYWSDGTIDTIDFKSTEPTPEPSTLLLLCTGILGVGVAGSRKYFSRVFSNARTRGVSAAHAGYFVAQSSVDAWAYPAHAGQQVPQYTSPASMSGQ